MLYNNSGPPNSDFLSLLSHAQELVDADRVHEARRLLAQFVERKLVDARMLPVLAALYLRVGKPRKAIATMRDAVKQLEPSAEVLNTFGLLLSTIGREQESREQFEEALKLEESNPEVLRNLAFALHRAGEHDAAYTMLVRCYDAAPLSAELRLIWGTLCELDGAIDDAICCYHDVIELSSVSEHVQLVSERLLRFDNQETSTTFEEIVARMRPDGVSANGAGEETTTE